MVGFRAQFPSINIGDEGFGIFKLPIRRDMIWYYTAFPSYEYDEISKTIQWIIKASEDFRFYNADTLNGSINAPLPMQKYHSSYSNFKGEEIWTDSDKDRFIIVGKYNKELDVSDWKRTKIKDKNVYLKEDGRVVLCLYKHNQSYIVVVGTMSLK